MSHSSISRSSRASARPSEGPGTSPALPATRGGFAHAFLHDRRSFALVEDCCARLGLSVVRHPVNTAPNPTELDRALVLLEVPSGFDRRFDWCLRFKQAQPRSRIAVLIGQPTRSRVIQAFAARADLVLGWPTEPLEAALRLRRLIEPEPSGPEI